MAIWYLIVWSMFVNQRFCDSPLRQAVSHSPDKRFVIRRDVYGHYWGPTVGYSCDFLIVDTHRFLWRRVQTLVYARGLPRAVVRWPSNTQVEIDLYLHKQESLEGKYPWHDDLKVTMREFPEDTDDPHKAIPSVPAK